MAAPAHIARENGKKGGRPRGRKNQQTIVKETARMLFEQRILRNIQPLLNSQFSLAFGQQFLFRIDTVKAGKGCHHCGLRREFFLSKPCLTGLTHRETRMKSERKRPVLVTAPREIEKYLDSMLNGEDKENEEYLNDVYYYITTKEPDNGAIDSMFDRTIGRAVTQTKLVDDNGKAVPITSINVAPIELNDPKTQSKKKSA